jgi:cysteinyl-tRNA synthetase
MAVTCAEFNNARVQFGTALDDDLNISGALGALFDFIRDVNSRLAKDGVTVQEAFLILDGWKELDAVLGLGIPRKELVPGEVRQLAHDRLEARKAKDFKRADEIRDRLLQMGWIVTDLRGGAVSYKRVG